MKNYLKLVRIENLIIIALTQYLVYANIIIPIRAEANILPYLPINAFIFIVLATVLIAAGGNAINDYFDMRIDRINKPDKMILGKHIKRRVAILFNNLFNGLGVIFGFVASYYIGRVSLGLIFLSMSVFLLFYSSTLKKQFLIGNVLIAIMSGFVPLIIGLFENMGFGVVSSEKIIIITIIYASFAFLISFVREIVKDMEDVDGDSACGCKTMAVVLGFQKCKNIVNYIITFIILVVSTNLVILFYKHWWVLLAYSILFVLIPLLVVNHKVFKSKSKTDMHFVSTMFKWIMFTGVMSTFVLKYYL